MVKKSVILSLIGIVFLQITSCLENPQCTDQQEETINFNFISSENGSPLLLNIDSVWIIEQDTNLYRDIALEGGAFEITPSIKEFTIRFLGAEIDGTIALDYKVIPKLTAEDCDVTFIYVDQNIKYTTFDSLVLKIDAEPISLNIYL